MFDNADESVDEERVVDGLCVAMTLWKCVAHSEEVGKQVEQRTRWRREGGDRQARLD